MKKIKKDIQAASGNIVIHNDTKAAPATPDADEFVIQRDPFVPMRRLVLAESSDLPFYQTYALTVIPSRWNPSVLNHTSLILVVLPT